MRSFRVYPSACVVAQTHQDHEIIVVEDGGTSGIQDSLADRSLDLVHYLQHDVHRDLAAARNTGVSHARGEYVAFLDDDDEWEPSKLELQMEIALYQEESNAVVDCGAAIYSNDRADIGYNPPILKGNLRDAIRRKGLWSVPSSLLIRRDDILGLGGFDESMPTHVDHDSHLALAEAGFWACTVDKPLVRTTDDWGPRMITDTEERTRGLDLFFEKWGPRLTEWLGERDFEAFARNLYARVGGFVIADLLRHKQLGESLCFVRRVQQAHSDPALILHMLLISLRTVGTRSVLYVRLKGRRSPS